MRAHADSVARVIRSPLTAVHFVTTLEEMPIQETLDGLAEMRGLGIQVGGIFINKVHPDGLAEAHLKAAAEGRTDEAEIALGLKAAGLADAQTLAAGLAIELAEHARNVALQEQPDRARPACMAAITVNIILACTTRRLDQAERLMQGLDELDTAGTARPPCADLLMITLHRAPLMIGHQAEHHPRPAGRQDHRARRHRPTPSRPRQHLDLNLIDRQHGPDLPGQHPTAGGHGPVVARQPARHDAGHEADLRRDRRGPRGPGPRRADPANPFYQSLSSSFAGRCRSTWPWRSWASCTAPASGT